MRQFNLNGKLLEFDESLQYAEFFVFVNEPKKEYPPWEHILEALENGMLLWGEAYPWFKLASRWVLEAPRKRHFRDLKRSGVSVFSAEYFFEQDGGENFIDALENSGKLAAAVLKIYGEEPVGPIIHDDPINPTSVSEVLDG